MQPCSVTCCGQLVHSVVDDTKAPMMLSEGLAACKVWQLMKGNRYLLILNTIICNLYHEICIDAL